MSLKLLITCTNLNVEASTRAGHALSRHIPCVRRGKYQLLKNQELGLKKFISILHVVLLLHADNRFISPVAEFQYKYTGMCNTSSIRHIYHSESQ